VGEYEITARVGVGGMGAVYEGRQPLIGKRVAVKVLLPQLSTDAGLVARFLDEARAVNEIRHRGIVDIFSFGELPEGAHYFVMEYLEGTAFDRLIRQRAPLPVAEALLHIEEVLDALGAAHSAGVVHRDIKPSNLFLVNTGRGKPYVKLLDFGIAKLGMVDGAATPQTRASVIMGTPDYISPEQARGQPVSPQTDLYAVGCVLFELVTGRRVFSSENPLQTMWCHVEDPPPLPSSLNPALPPQLDEVILWALEKVAARRPPSAQVMAEHLAAIRASVSTAPLTPVPVRGASTGSSPPLSVRDRVQAATPAPGTQAPLKTPAPRSSRTPAPRQRPATPTRVAPAETRLESLAALTQGALEPLEEGSRQSSGVEDEVPAPSAEVSLPPRSRAPMVGLVVGLAVVGALGGAWVMSAGTSAPVVVAKPEPKVEPVVAKPEPKVEPAVATPEPKVEPAVATPEPKVEPVVVPEPKPVVTPVRKGVTAEQLQARLKTLAQKLAAHEAQTQENAPLLRQLLAQATKEVAEATTDQQRREAWRTLDDLSMQFPK
jgi:serine/threonine-protein kinase